MLMSKKDISFHIKGILGNNVTNLNVDSSWIDETNYTRKKI